MKNNQLRSKQLSYVITIARAGLKPWSFETETRLRLDTRLYVSCFSLS